MPPILKSSAEQKGISRKKSRPTDKMFSLKPRRTEGLKSDFATKDTQVHPMRKAQGISLNVVVIAAIALLILVILTVIVIQRTSRFQQGFSCEDVPGARCMEQCGGSNPIYNRQYDCPVGIGGERLRCCLANEGENSYNGPGSAIN